LPGAVDVDVVVVFFSQTDNTRKIAEAIADTFRAVGDEVSVILLKDADSKIALSADLLCIGTPCFSSKAPQPIMRFIKSLPDMENQKAFIFATCGGAPGRVLYDMGNALRKKGSNLIGGSLFRGEVHHPAPSLSGRFSGRPNAKDLNRARSFAKTMRIRCSTDNFTTLHNNYVSATKYRLRFYDLLGTFIPDSSLRLLLPEPNLVLANCDQCGWCAQECPTQNITLKPYPLLGSDCIRCYHCYNGCPRKAFTTNWRISNPILWVLYNQAFVRLFGDLEPGERIY
jgi:flavodoxin